MTFIRYIKKFMKNEITLVPITNPKWNEKKQDRRWDRTIFRNKYIDTISRLKR